MKGLYKNKTVAEATANMFAAWRSDNEADVQAAAEKWSEAIFEQIREEYEIYGNDMSALAARGYRQLTTEETEFYNALIKKAGSIKIEVQYSLNKKFPMDETKSKYVGKKKASAKLGGLKTKKTYYIRVRTVKTVSGTKKVSGWSTVKKVKVK